MPSSKKPNQTENINENNGGKVDEEKLFLQLCPVWQG